MVLNIHSQMIYIYIHCYCFGECKTRLFTQAYTRWHTLVERKKHVMQSVLLYLK